MKTPLLLTLLTAGFPTLLLAGPVPVSAVIRPLPPASSKIDTRESGDVMVKFDDATTASWTKSQPCLLPLVSASQRLVGWTKGKITPTKQNGTTLVNDQLRIAAGGKVIATLTDPLMIEEWNFLDDEKSVVIKSRGFHGPATSSGEKAPKRFSNRSDSSHFASPLHPKVSSEEAAQAPPASAAGKCVRQTKAGRND
jgi:hypothetical protein